eukprot:COSAG01_NODE_4090_length_5360_cov_26.230184_4_plen_253_part_00
MNLTSWSVRYPFFEEDSEFSSSDTMLTKVYNLCRNTLRRTSLDTWTDSNTRERNVYEGDGFVTSSARYALQREYKWPLHSARSVFMNGRLTHSKPISHPFLSCRFQFLNPTSFTEYHQLMPVIAWEYFMQTGDASLAADYWDLLKEATYTQCTDPSSGLVNFTNCSRESCLWNATSKVNDLVDWPMHFRDGYVMTNVSTEVGLHHIYITYMCSLQFVSSNSYRVLTLVAGECIHRLRIQEASRAGSSYRQAS